jgi:hypothetical protein
MSYKYSIMKLSKILSGIVLTGFSGFAVFTGLLAKGMSVQSTVSDSAQSRITSMIIGGGIVCFGGIYMTCSGFVEDSDGM